jgi:hypothetical protein
LTPNQINRSNDVNTDEENKKKFTKIINGNKLGMINIRLFYEYDYSSIGLTFGGLDTSDPVIRPYIRTKLLELEYI